jgi:hypothetical protein
MMYHALIIVVILLVWRSVRRYCQCREGFSLFPPEDDAIPDDNSVIDIEHSSGTNSINITYNYHVYS